MRCDSLVGQGGWCGRWSIMWLLLAPEFCEWNARILFHFFSLLHIEVGEVPDELAHLTGSWVILGWCYGRGASASVGRCACCRDVGPVFWCEVTCMRWRHVACVRRWARVRSRDERACESSDDGEHEARVEPVSAVRWRLWVVKVGARRPGEWAVPHWHA